MSSDKKKYKIVFLPKSGSDPQQSIVNGLAQVLTDRGHHVVIVVNNSGLGNRLLDLSEAQNKSVDELLEEVQSEDVQVENKSVGEEVVEKKAEQTVVKQENQYIMALKDKIDYERLQELLKPAQDTAIKLKDLALNVFGDVKRYYTSLTQRNDQLGVLIDKFDPDIFVFNGAIEFESINKTGKPWVWLFNGNPLPFLEDKTVPLPYSGTPISWTKLPFWKLARTVLDFYTTAGFKLFNYAMMARKTPFRLILSGSPYLTIYAYPNELDYNERSDWKTNFYRLDTFTPKAKLNTISITTAFPKFQGSKDKKIILVTIGKFHSGNIHFMDGLVTKLSNSGYNYVLHKQFTPKEFDFPSNMVLAEKTLTLKQLITLSDLVITDGSNETVVEAFALGKPMIALPFWLEQLDNAQRLHETGYGIRLSPLTYTRDDLLDAIDKLLTDSRFKERINAAHKRIIDEDRLVKAAELIENLGVDKYIYREDKL